MALLGTLLTGMNAMATIAPAGSETKPLQFTSGGHIVGFTPKDLYVASGSHALRIEFVGAQGVQPIAAGAASPDGKASPLTCVTYPGIWSGITLAYDAPAGLLRSTYTLAPGADPAKIRLRYNAPVAVEPTGDLRIAFANGAMKESAPVAWQEKDGCRVPVSVDFRKESEREVGFALGPYDKDRPLTIDPTLTWNTFLGGTGGDEGNGIAVDASGNIYVTGESDGTWGKPIRTFAGSWDAFVAKITNTLPVALNQVLSTPKDTAKAITLSAPDADGNSLTYSVVTLPAHGTLSGTAPDQTYTPNLNYCGTDSFTFKVNDGKVDSAVATIKIKIFVGRALSNDFDGDGRSDIGCYYPVGGNWYGFNSTTGFWSTQFGYQGTLPITGDFDGDGKSDIGVYHPPTGTWCISKSKEGFAQFPFGYAGTIPVVGDFDGDGHSDIGCYYPAGGNWNGFNSTKGFWSTQFGYAGTIPVTGDFDGDGKSDIGVYHPPTGTWYIFKSTEGFWQTQFGYAGTIPVVGDFDGDGRDDIGCYYAPGGNWYVFKSTEGFWQTTFGYDGTEPVVGDFDGDGKADFGCYYPTGGNWYLYKSTEGFWQTQFGYSGTIPLGGRLR